MPEINVDLIDDDQTIEVPINAIFGTGIERIETTHTSTGDGDPNIITIYLTNGTQYSFAVYNGVNGRDGVDGTDGTDGVDGITPVATLSTGTSWDGRVVHTLTIQALPQYVVSTQIYDGLDGTNGRDGVDGTDGTDGVDGFSPYITITTITGGHRVTVTDVNGSQSFDVMDGTGGGGTGDYDDLTNRPQINSTVLTGNKTAESLGIYGVYWCTYGVTTSAQIENAYQEGKLVCLMYNDRLYTLRYRNSSTNHRFICNYGHAEYDVACQSGLWITNATTTFYSKPSGGIPKSDLASDVQTSLGKADTALQSAPVSSVNGQTGAVTIGNATTSAAGLMSATDKSHLDDVYADYSSALAALGV